MTIEDLEWIKSVQDQAYRLYAINRLPDDDYEELDRVLDNIQSKHGVNVNNENDIQP